MHKKTSWLGQPKATFYLEHVTLPKKLIIITCFQCCRNIQNSFRVNKKNLPAAVSKNASVAVILTISFLRNTCTSEQKMRNFKYFPSWSSIINYIDRTIDFDQSAYKYVWHYDLRYHLRKTACQNLYSFLTYRHFWKRSIIDRSIDFDQSIFR